VLKNAVEKSAESYMTYKADALFGTAIAILVMNGATVPWNSGVPSLLIATLVSNAKSMILYPLVAEVVAKPINRSRIVVVATEEEAVMMMMMKKTRKIVADAIGVEGEMKTMRMTKRITAAAGIDAEEE